MANILIIDDDANIRKSLKRILHNKKYNILEAPNGMVGLELCHKNDIDIVITDIFMPVIDGIETIKLLKKDFPHIKIIAISGGGISSLNLSTKTEFLAIAKSLGVERTFSKPFNMNDMVQAVHNLLH